MMRLAPYFGMMLSTLLGASCMMADASRALEGAVPQCVNVDDCGDGYVCFLGGCVPDGEGISTIYAHITPANDSAYLPQEIPGAVVLDDSLEVQWSLQEAITLTGSLDSANTAVEGGLLKAAYQSTIPGREGSLHQTILDNGDFSLKVVPGNYTCTFAPEVVNNLPTINLEKSSGAIWAFNSDASLTINYPETEQLITIAGSLKKQEEDSATSPIAGALIRGSGMSPGGREVQSTSVETDASGLFSLIFPEGSTELKVHVESGTETLLPEKVVALTDEDDLDNLELLLEVPNQYTISIDVSDAGNAAASDVSLLLEGQTDAGVFKTSATTDQNGKVENLEIFAGQYKIYAIPPVSQQSAARSFDVDLEAPESTALSFTLSNKIKLSGKISADDGSAAKNASIRVKHILGDAVRQFNTNSDDMGNYEVMIDPGDAETPLQYEFSAQFNATSELPFHRKLLNIYHQSTPLHITLYRPAFIHGKITTPENTGLPEAIVSIYSTEFSSNNSTPLLMGIALTDETGEFVLPIPSATD